MDVVVINVAIMSKVGFWDDWNPNHECEEHSLDSYTFLVSSLPFHLKFSCETTTISRLIGFIVPFSELTEIQSVGNIADSLQTRKYERK